MFVNGTLFLVTFMASSVFDTVVVVIWLVVVLESVVKVLLILVSGSVRRSL